ncbi:MAG: hypothetical protein SOT82_01580 [Oscillospiraceae bacterium]|nr:hypothetical protein [Oscillospiraceae bacterium]
MQDKKCAAAKQAAYRALSMRKMQEGRACGCAGKQEFLHKKDSQIAQHRAGSGFGRIFPLFRKNSCIILQAVRHFPSCAIGKITVFFRENGCKSVWDML